MKIWPKSAKRWHSLPNDSRLPQPQRLLLARPDRLGDVVITTTCLDEIRRQLPHTHITFAVRQPYAFLFEDHPCIDSCLPLETRIDEDTLANQLKALDFDVFANLNPEPALESAARKAGISQRLGFSKGKGERLTAWIHNDWKKRGTQHEAYYNFDLLEPFGITAPRKLKPCLIAPEQSIRDARNILGKGPNAIMHLASHGNKPRVPAPFFAAISKRLHKENKTNIFIVGENHDDPGITEFLDAMGPAAKDVQNLAGKTSVEALAGLVKVADLMVSRDSGPAHLAAALGCPTLTFFLNPKPLMSPRRWAPIGPAVRIYTKPILTLPYEPPHRLARRTVRLFNPDEAYQEALSLMKIYSNNKPILR